MPDYNFLWSQAQFESVGKIDLEQIRMAEAMKGTCCNESIDWVHVPVSQTCSSFAFYYENGMYIF